MKALIEIELKKSCFECDLYIKVPHPLNGIEFKCGLIKDFTYQPGLDKTRHTLCPIKIKPDCNDATMTRDGECIGYQFHYGMENELALACLECKKNKCFARAENSRPDNKRVIYKLEVLNEPNT